MTLPACLYLHGFLSSSASQKAQQLRQWYEQRGCAERLATPDLSFAPSDAIAEAETALLALQQRFGSVLIIGSSLGGYYATYLAERHACVAALINPAVAPYRLFADYLGEHEHFYRGTRHTLTLEHIEQLHALDCPVLRHPERLLLLLQTADETLDYRLAADYYRQCPSWLEGGGNHSFMHFVERLPMIVTFAQRHAAISNNRQ